MRGRLRRWLPPLALLLGSVAAAVAVVGIESGAARAAEPVGGLRLVTPVISARRVPTVVAAPIAERRLADDLDVWLAGQPPDTCLVVRSDSDDVAFDHRGDASLVPASTAKIVTGTAALRRLGADARFQTVVAAAAAPAGGVVAGDLLLIGGGDPLLATAHYAARFRRQPQTFTDIDALAADVAAAGVTRVEGSVVGDASRYQGPAYLPEWPARYIEGDDVGPLSALSVNDGFADYPPAPDAPGELDAAADPAAHAAAVFTFLLEAHGVEVVGPPRTGVAPPAHLEIAAVDSPPLVEVVAQMLRESDNNTAELLMREVGTAVGEPTTAGGRAAALASIAGAGVDTSGITIADGSGLGLDNRVTCRSLVDLLTGAPPAPALVDGLPVAGRTGTLAERFADSAVAGHMRAKTGTLNTVTSLAGVVDDGDGTLTFALVVNTEPGEFVSADLVGSQEDLGEILLAWPRVPDLDRLGPRPPVAG